MSQSTRDGETDAPGPASRVVTLGEAMLRLSTPARLERATALDIHVAGSEANVAVALAQLGWDAVWLTGLPPTPLGRRVANEVRSAGVDIHVRWVADARVGVFFVEYGEPPRPVTVWYDRAGSAATRLGSDDLDVTVLDGARYAVVSGITPGISASAAALAQRFATESKRRQVRLCVDVNYRPRLWPEDAARDAIAKLVAQADIVICSRRDASRLWQIAGDSRQAVQELRRRLAPAAELVVLTLSEDGSCASLPDGTVLEQPAHPAKVVDRIGAGDAFVAGLLWGLEEGETADALRCAAVAAATKCSIRGDHLLTSRAEFLELLAASKIEVLR